MKVLLTGATGLIGRELGKALVARGHEVLAVSRSASKARLKLPYPATIVEWSGKGDFPSQLLQSVDAVIHLMGENISESRWTEEVKRKMRESRVGATLDLRQACMQHAKNLKVWIQGSAIGIYGGSQEGRTQSLDSDEYSPAGLGFLPELCQEWEAAFEMPDVRKVVLRTGVVISHQGGALAKMIPPLFAGVGGVVSSGKQRMSLIHLEDEVGFIVHALESEKVSGFYNLVCDQPVSQRDFISILADQLGISKGLPVPAFAIRMAFGEMAQILLNDQPVVSKRIRETGYRFRYPGVLDILKEVAGWYRHPFSSGEKTLAPAHVFYSEQFIPRPIREVFQFFSDAGNLEKITPSWLHFHIESMSTPSIQKNTQIVYRLKLHGIPLKWVTDIESWDPPRSFVDQQISGPYRLWYHRHDFEEIPGGTLMKDWVRFQVPLGKAGSIGLPLVERDVNAIFGHRSEIISKLFLNN